MGFVKRQEEKVYIFHAGKNVFVKVFVNSKQVNILQFLPNFFHFIMEINNKQPTEPPIFPKHLSKVPSTIVLSFYKNKYTNEIPLLDIFFKQKLWKARALPWFWEVNSKFWLFLWVTPFDKVQNLSHKNSFLFLIFIYI